MADESDDSQSMPPLKQTPKIVIIGAGISGLAAANKLSKAGIDDYVILEASDRVGGRIWSIDLEGIPGEKAELGANWIHGVEQNPIFKLAKQNGILSEDYTGRGLGKQMLFRTEQGDVVNTKIVRDLDIHYGQLMMDCEEFYMSGMGDPDDSVGDYIVRSVQHTIQHLVPAEKALRRRILDQRLLGECVIAGAHTMADVSLSQFGAFQELPGVHYVIPGGFEKVCDLLRANIPDAKIHLNTQVATVDWSSEERNANHYPVCVECVSGQRLYADHVLVTVSLGVLKQQASRLFHPALPPWKQDAIKSLTFGTVNKIILEFDGQVLPDNVFRLECVWDRDNIADDTPLTADTWVKKIGAFEAIAPNVLVGWLSGREAEHMETLSEAVVGETCRAAIHRFLKNDVNSMPQLTKVTRSMWKSHPSILGSYVFIPVGGSADHVVAMAEPVPRQAGASPGEDEDEDEETIDSAGPKPKPLLLFAGEATHPSYFSSSHGALLSGQREAKRIIDLYSQ